MELLDNFRSEELSDFLNSYDDCILYPNIVCDYLTPLQRRISKPVKVFLMTVICLAVIFVPCYCLRKRKRRQRRSLVQHQGQQPATRRCRLKQRILPIVATWLVLSFIVGFIVEYIRLYQLHKAKKMATLSKNKPLQCEPEMMNAMHRIWYFVWDMISWRRDECLEFYEALVVDPLWEITPPMVIMSLVTRTIVTPLHDISTSLGHSIHNFIQYIPSIWQLPAFLCIIILIIICIFVSCRYKIAGPFISVEPNRSLTRESVRRR